MTKFRDSILQKLFALIAFLACLGIFLEIKGLFLVDGILPFSLIHTQYNLSNNFFKLPSLFLINASDGFIYFVWILMSLVLIVLFFNFIYNRIFRALLFLVFYVCYLSFVNFGEPFMSFQWDALLLEMSFLFFWYFILSQDDKLSSFNIWFFRILIFKLMFMSGIVKLFSGDKAWLDMSALEYHYFTQPLPSIGSFFVHQLPTGFHKLCCVLMFIIELIFPFFIFMGKKLREIAAWSFIVLQIIIFLTGNYGFFNLLTMLLAFSLFDFSHGFPRTFKFHKNFMLVSQVSLSLYALLSFSWIFTRIPSPDFLKIPVKLYVKSFARLHLNNPYGLFAVMTKKRGEIVIQGAQNTPGQMSLEWKDYTFKYKPQDPKRLPIQIAPLQPRLDWQMWFAALGTYKQNPWFMNLVRRLLENKKEVTDLLKYNPFSKEAPVAIRALYYEYEYNDFATYKKTGEVWKRKYTKVYLPEISLRNSR